MAADTAAGQGAEAPPDIALDTGGPLLVGWTGEAKAVPPPPTLPLRPPVFSWWGCCRGCFSVRPQGFVPVSCRITPVLFGALCANCERLRRIQILYARLNAEGDAARMTERMLKLLECFLADAVSSMPPERNMDLCRWVVNDAAHQRALIQGQSQSELPREFGVYNSAQAAADAWTSGSGLPETGPHPIHLPLWHPSNYFEGDAWTSVSALDGRDWTSANRNSAQEEEPLPATPSAWDMPGGWGAPASPQAAAPSSPAPLSAYGSLFVALGRAPTEAELLQANPLSSMSEASEMEATSQVTSGGAPAGGIPEIFTPVSEYF